MIDRMTYRWAMTPKGDKYIIHADVVNGHKQRDAIVSEVVGHAVAQHIVQMHNDSVREVASFARKRYTAGESRSIN